MKTPYTLAEFQADKDAVADLTAFLATETGVKLVAVLATHDPLNGLSELEQWGPNTARGMAKLQEGAAESLLGVCQGYRLALKTLDRLTTYNPRPEPQSRKGGAHPKPHETNLPS